MRLQEKINVIALFNSKLGIYQPQYIKWNNRTYRTEQIGQHHKEKFGQVLTHVWSLMASGTHFRVRFNTDTLQWVVEYIQTPDET